MNRDSKNSEHDGSSRDLQSAAGASEDGKPLPVG